MEQWKVLDFEKGYENYSVSNMGRIKNVRTNFILKPSENNTGYYRVNLYNTVTKKQKKFLIHRLVALYFVEGDKTLVVNHKDGNKHNLCATNLEWVTCSQNNKHAYDIGLKEGEKGIDNPSNVYPEELIKDICELIEEHISTKEISIKIFGMYISKYKNLINHIKAKRRWVHISKDYDF